MLIYGILIRYSCQILVASIYVADVYKHLSRVHTNYKNLVQMRRANYTYDTRQCSVPTITESVS